MAVSNDNTHSDDRMAHDSPMECGDSIDLDDEYPWQTADHEARIEQAKLQAEERQNFHPNYGKLE